MIVLVVLLAFGLTVGGIVYLAKFLIGEDKPSPAQSVPPPAVIAPENDTVVRFSIDNASDNDTAVITPDTPAALPPPVTPAPAAPSAAAKPPVPPQIAVPTGDVPSVSPTGGRYQLQLFAFRSENSARSEAQKYRKDYPDIFVMKADLGANGIWYRVRCCSTDSRDEVAHVKADMETKYKIKADIVNAK